MSKEMMWRKASMITSSNGNIFRVTGPLCGEITGTENEGQWRGALMFSLISVWINGWVNNREAGDLKRHRGHYDVNVMRFEGTPIGLPAPKIGGLGCIHSSPPSAAYIRQWISSVIVQIMACRLFGAKSLSKPMLVCCQLDPYRNKRQWNNNQNTILFIHENAFENIVCVIGVILSRGRWVN